MSPTGLSLNDTYQPFVFSKLWAELKVGDVFTFGNYPQGENGEVKPIEWQILRRDSDGLWAISRYGLDCIPYDSDWRITNWSECALRAWLNSGFLNTAFSPSEREHIVSVHLDNPDSKFDEGTPGGPETDDMIFLLSQNEAETMLASDVARYCKPTPYAMAQGVWVYEYEADHDEKWKKCSGNCFWWLRSPGLLKISAACVSDIGDISYYYVNRPSLALRPAFKITM